MTIFDALRHQGRQWIRSSTLERSLFSVFFLIVGGLYIAALFVAMGWFFPDLISALLPDREPLPLLNEWLLYGFGGLLLARFFLQRSAGSDVQPYLPLPLRRSQLVRILQATSSLSLFNLLPVVLLGALWGSTVVPSASTTGAVFWGLGGLLAVAVTQFANSLLRVTWDRGAAWVLTAGALAAGAVIAGLLMGQGSLRAASTLLFGGLSAGRWMPLIVLGVLTVGVALVAHRTLRAQIYTVTANEASPARVSVSSGAGIGRGWGPTRVTSLVLLDAKLLLRNKRPRQLLLMGVMLVGLFLFIIGSEAPTSFDKVVFGFFLSGYFALSYCQYSYAWHGGHFDGLIVRAVPPRSQVLAQFATFTGLCVLPSAIIAPILGGIRPQLLGSLGAFLLYNLGVTAPILLGLGVWNREAMQLDQTVFFNYQGTSYLHLLATLPILILPFGLLIGAGISTTILAVAGLGLLGLCTVPLWTRGISRMLHWQRHSMAAGFRREE